MKMITIIIIKIKIVINDFSMSSGCPDFLFGMNENGEMTNFHSFLF